MAIINLNNNLKMNLKLFAALLVVCLFAFGEAKELVLTEERIRDDWKDV